MPTEIRPSDGCYNGFNVFARTVSSPKQSYYLNDTTDFDGAHRQPQAVYVIGQTVTIPISGQAKLDFYTIDGDHHQVTAFSGPSRRRREPAGARRLAVTGADRSTHRNDRW